MENNIISVNQISFENIRTFNIQIISKYYSLFARIFPTYIPFDSLIFPPFTYEHSNPTNDREKFSNTAPLDLDRSSYRC